MTERVNVPESGSGRVLVTGAAGFIGQECCRQLLADGWAVRALIHRSLPEWFAGAGVEVFRGDLADPRTLARAVAGVDRIVHLAGRKSDEADSWGVNVEGARSLAAAAEAAGVGRIVNVSTQAATYARRDRYGLSKAAADQVIAEAIVEHITLVPSLVYGDDQTGVFAKLRNAARNLPVIPVIGDGTAVFQPIHVVDLASVIVAAVGIEPLPRARYFIGGPDPLTFDQIIDLAEGDVGRRKPRVHLPWGLTLLLAKFLRVLPNPPISVSNVLGAAAANQDVHDLGPMISELGIAPRRMGDWAREAETSEPETPR